MKRFRLVLALAAIVLASCGGDKKSITPVSEKITGPLGEFFEVVSKDYKIVDGKAGVEIKRTKAGFPEPWTEGMKVGYDDGCFEPTFTIEFQDEDGTTLSKDKTDIVFDREALESIAALGVDESATVSFDLEKKEGTSKFKMGSTFEVHGEGVAQESAEEKTLSLEGSIGKYPVVMTMHIDATGNVTGAYYYKKKGPGNYLYIKGQESNGRYTINEFTKKGEQTGSYDGSFSGETFSGNFYTKSGDYQFVLKPSDEAIIDFSDIDFSSFVGQYISRYAEEDDEYESGSSSTSDSNDWDALLDSYERYVDKYISCMKKAANGDMSALSEYPSLLEEAQEYSEKLQNAQGEMTSAQWNRYLKITNKLANAAQ